MASSGTVPRAASAIVPPPHRTRSPPQSCLIAARSSSKSETRPPLPNGSPSRPLPGPDSSSASNIGGFPSALSPAGAARQLRPQHHHHHRHGSSNESVVSPDSQPHPQPHLQPHLPPQPHPPSCSRPVSSSHVHPTDHIQPVPGLGPGPESATVTVLSELTTGLLLPLSLILAHTPAPLVSVTGPIQSRPEFVHTLLGTAILAAGGLMVSGLVRPLLSASFNSSTASSFAQFSPFLRSFPSLGHTTRARLASGVFLRALHTLVPLFAAAELGPTTVALAVLTILASGINILPSRAQIPSPTSPPTSSPWWLLTRVASTARSAARASPISACVASVLYFSVLVQVFSRPSNGAVVSGLIALSSLTASLLGPDYQALYPDSQAARIHTFRDTSDPSLLFPSRSFGKPTNSAAGPAPSLVPEAALEPFLSVCAAGLLTFIAVFLASLAQPDLSFSRAFPIAIAALAAALLFAHPLTLRSAHRVGLGLGCFVVSLISLASLLTGSTHRLSPHFHSHHHQSNWAGPLWEILLAVAVFAAGYSDSSSARTPKEGSTMALAEKDRHHHNRHNHSHHHHHPAMSKTHSTVTTALIRLTAPGSILRAILVEDDSRQIAYFGCLNLAFMLVQFTYGFLTHSLGLLSDSIHMLFDCAGLAVGLAAAVMTKWPATREFPYGYGLVETLSGFANGVFLILVSVEIVTDAVGRLRDGRELRRVNELLVVSVLGFVVNIVGLLAFGHAHHHHGHGHGDGSHHHHHHHKDQPEGEQQDNHRCHSEKEHAHSHTHSHSETGVHSHDYGHGHDHNENMQGIFLHILADALGSASVILSTILAKWTGWSGWDPIASCAISALIFASAIPLVTRSGSRLLLSLSHHSDWQVRQALGELGNLPGVVGYRYARFWSGTGTGTTAEPCHADKCTSHPSPPPSSSLKGAIHIITTSQYDVEDVRHRASRFLASAGLDLVVHVERDTDAANCWCSAHSLVASGLAASAGPGGSATMPISIPSAATPATATSSSFLLPDDLHSARSAGNGLSFSSPVGSAENVYARSPGAFYHGRRNGGPGPGWSGFGSSPVKR